MRDVLNVKFTVREELGEEGQGEEETTGSHSRSMNFQLPAAIEDSAVCM